MFASAIGIKLDVRTYDSKGRWSRHPVRYTWPLRERSSTLPSGMYNSFECRPISGVHRSVQRAATHTEQTAGGSAGVTDTQTEKCTKLAPPWNG